jgi:arylsulfatase A-like enzyme
MKPTKLPLILLLAMASLGFAAETKPLSGSRPNIILLLTDDQGLGDLSCTGNPYLKTPNLDRIHALGSRFTDFHVSPGCSPTRSAIMSGRHEFEVGVTHTIFQRERLAPGVVTIAEALRRAGYSTGLFGKWHLGDDKAYLPQQRGFDEVLMHGAGGIGQFKWGDFEENSKNPYFDSVLLHNDTIVRTKGFCTDLFFAAAMAWINQQHAEKKPFFAYIPLNAPHGPMIAPDKYKKRFLDLGFDNQSAARYGMIENLDDNVGLLLADLESHGMLEDTLVVFMTDNGMSMPTGSIHGKKFTPFNAGMKGSKCTPNEGGTRVPSFWMWKGHVQEGLDIPALAAHIDLYRTFCDLAGAKIPSSSLEPGGRSLVPLLENPKTDWPDRTLFLHVGRWNPGERDPSKYKGCAVRTSRWRLVNNNELYDILADRGQTKDVATQNPEVVADLRKKFDAWWDSLTPLLVNEGLPDIKPGDFPLQKLHRTTQGELPLWEPVSSK